MRDYIVLFHERGDVKPGDPPLIFHCSADDADHAEEQCLDAYLGCRVAWIHEGSDWRSAFADYGAD